MKSTLAQIFEELLHEVESNSDLRARIDRLLTPAGNKGALVGPAPKRKNRRSPPAFDPYAEIKGGEAALRQKLAALTLEQLKDIVSAFALDASRLALKWKDPVRVSDLIITTVRSRIEKGDAFRAEPEKAA